MVFYLYSSSDDDSEPEIPGFPEQSVAFSPILAFSSVRRFEKRHRIGTEKEFVFDKSELEMINRGDTQWVVFVVSSAFSDKIKNPKAKPVTQGFKHDAKWWFLVRPGLHDAKLPKEGEECHITFRTGRKWIQQPSGPDKPIPDSERWKVTTTRVENPCASWGQDSKYWIDCMAFTVTLPAYLSNDLTMGAPSSYWERPFPLEGVQFVLRISTSTRDAEIGALNKLVEAWEQRTAGCGAQVAAFEYLMSFQGKSNTSLFDLFPHLPANLSSLDTNTSGSLLPLKLQQRLKSFDDMQKAVYEFCLANCHDRICFVPGGPGAGKTFWNLTVASALQEKVLYLIDLNLPLTDVSNSMLRLHRDLYFGTDAWAPWAVIRMFCWSWEKRSSSWGRIGVQKDELAERLKLKEAGEKPDKDSGPLSQYDPKKDTSERVQLQGFQETFHQTQRPSLGVDKGEMFSEAPTLDEAAAAYYEAHKDTKYKAITKFLSVDREGLKDLGGYLIDQLYRDTLKEAKFVATTPVTASKFAEALFQPSVIMFDEAPHARELSVLISIANFAPKMWLLTGDHHQTKPYVGSYGHKPILNQYKEQLHVSTMERFCKLNPDSKALLTNHRAYGGLEALASGLFYQGRMKPGKNNGPDAQLPASTLHLRDKYIMPLKHNLGPKVSRLLVVLKSAAELTQVQTSWHHPGHRAWVMRLVRKLTRDQRFQQVNSTERGSVLIMSHYAQAKIEYCKAIEAMRKTPKGLGACVVEARSVDTAQGHEADFTILDFVRGHSTKHLENPNRLCVGITRARQAEIIIMHRGMITQLETNLRFDHQKSLAAMIAECKKTGQFVYGPAKIWSD